MCGIFGLITTGEGVSRAAFRRGVKKLFLLSESRGKEASGAAIASDSRLGVLRSATPASELIRGPAYAKLLAETLDAAPASSPVALIGHSRLVTTGTQFDARNNQPVVAGASAGIHNGIIVNHEDLWRANPDLKRQTEVDTEVFYALLGRSLATDGNASRAARETFAAIDGTASVAGLFTDFDALLLATNNGSLYLGRDRNHRAVFFCSEAFIARTFAASGVLGISAADFEIAQIEAGTGRAVLLEDLDVLALELGPSDGTDVLLPRRRQARAVTAVSVGPSAGHEPPALMSIGRRDAPTGAAAEELVRVERLFPHDTARADALRRCTRCILPETMPFITFDADGVCSYCKRYRKVETKGLDALRELAQGARRGGAGPDCVVGLSGGRDSLYALHVVKRELGLTPVAYTYDWGMVTDLARRNISRICARLGVEHIVVSADIVRKRANIRSNVEAWLKRPRLGMIPLFMAGDKQYFHYLRQVQEQTGARMAVLGENMLERTDFKTGYAGVSPHNDAKHVYTLTTASKLKLLGYYGREFLLNPAYLNRSLADTAFASVCYYFLDRAYTNLFHYVPWIEDTIIGTLRREYDFELAPDTVSTWRIGDGTAAFYNYIYYHVSGFTENDTFRSNQIREGLMDRRRALELVAVENRPRFETMQWYLRIIGMTAPLEDILGRIRSMPPRVGGIH